MSELLELRVTMAKKLGEWSINPAKDEAEALTREIKFAYDNGIDLEFRVPKSVLRKGDESPLTRQDFMEFSDKTDSEDFIFNIPSKKTLENDRFNRGYALELRQLGAIYAIVLKGKEGDIAGFRTDEVSSIRLK